ncbi:MAG: NADH-quinone oxidoreductase subunit M [Verrucomicrobiales bacterium]|nr:NADH-quinone oxidoreductase subunit M [Verrucomicrobiales bacterium]
MAWLSFIILCPLVAALLIAVLPRNLRVLFRVLAVTATALSLAGALTVFFSFQTGSDGLQFEEYHPWIELLGAGYHLGVDGLNVGLVLLATVVAFAAACLAWEVTHREKEFYLLLLLMTGGVIGAFAAFDMLLFFVFHELALIPTFLMIGIWGRGPDRDYAAFKLTLYLMVGSLLVLLGLIGLHAAGGFRSLDMVDLQAHLAIDPAPVAWQRTLFGLLLAGFGMLVALWPFHTWAPTGYAAAPTPTAMLHAGVLKKFGLYGLIRVALPMLPEGARTWLPVLAVLCLGNILYSGLVAIRQRDLNLLIGNSSVAHVGFAFLGIASLNVLGVTGAVLVMVAHGFLAALLFGLNGWLHQRFGSTEMDRFGGLLVALPFAGTLLAMAMLAGCGLPGFAGFPGEALVLFGAWQYSRVLTVLAAWGALILAAVYMLRAIRTVLHGPLPEKLRGIAADVQNPWQRLPYALLLAGLVYFGVWPRALVDKVQPAAAEVVARARSWAAVPGSSMPSGTLLAGNDPEPGGTP